MTPTKRINRWLKVVAGRIVMGRDGRSRRRVFARRCAITTAVLTLAGLWGVAPAVAAINPGTIAIKANGTVLINTAPLPGQSTLVVTAALSVGGTIDAAGNITLSASQITGQATTKFSGGAAGAPAIFAVPSGWTVTLDPATGNLALTGALAVHYFLPGVFTDCNHTVNFHLTTGSSGSLTGVPYNASSGTATVVDNTFTVPNVTLNEPIACPASIVNIGSQSLGLPLGPGQSSANFTLSFFLPPPPLSVSQTVAPGGTVTTDPSGTGPTPSLPLQTSVTSPTGGTVSITVSAPTSPAPTGYSFVGLQTQITAPSASVSQPLVLVFAIDASRIPLGQDATTLQIFRNGLIVGPCTGPPGRAVPSPCISSRVTLGNGNVVITVLTTAASSWNLGVKTPVPALVTVQQHRFVPRVVTVDLAAPLVVWTFNATDCNIVDASGMGLFNSGTHSQGQQWEFSFPSAGTYPYHCDKRPSRTGKVLVPITTTVTSGTTASTFSLTWAPRIPPAGFTYDVQIKRPDTRWTDWMVGTSSSSAVFTPDAGTGHYLFRARLRKTASGMSSDWSPILSIDIS